MKVNIVGRNVTVTTEMETYALEKVGKLDRFFDGIQHVDIVMNVDGSENHTVEASAFLPKGVILVGKATAADMYAAIDQAESKVQKQVRRFHARLKDHRDRTRIGEGKAEASTEDVEATYEHVVREMLEEEEN